MRVEALIVPGIFLAFALVEMFRTNFFHKANQTRADAWVEVIGSVVLLAVTQPAILLMAYTLMALAVPDAAGAWAGLPIVAQVALFLVFDDMMQYWWHRASHSFSWLYNLHRAHHSGEYMSVRIVYRNNFFYYLTMPSL